MRRLAALLLLSGIVVTPAVALAQTTEGEVPVVDVVEIAGVLDRPLQRYALERLDEAEREGAALLVFQVDSLGGVKITERGELPEIVRRIRDASVPVAVHVGPRDARAGGAVLLMAGAAHISSAGLSATLGPALPIDFAHPDTANTSAFADLAAARGRTVRGFDAAADTFGASAAVDAGIADLAVPSVADMLERIDGRVVVTSAGPVTLTLPSDAIDIRFFQPGPLRRLLHTLANPALVYLLLIAGAAMVMFELFQPGFGIAGVTGAILLAAAGYGLTVLPAQWWGLGLVCLGLALMTLDVAIDGLGVPTVAGAVALAGGSIGLFPGGSDAVRLSPWLIGFTVVATLVMFVPVMTYVTRARAPIAREVRGQLIGEAGQVRSMLNPEGFIFVGGEIWRARSADGSRRRVGEDVVVDRIDGTTLIVSPAGEPSTAPADADA